jgi:hypothetical protein
VSFSKADILGIFVEAQERNPIHRHEGLNPISTSESRNNQRVEWTNERRRAKQSDKCACGCGSDLPWTRYPLRREYATHACAANAWTRRERKAKREEREARNPTCILCCAPIPRTSSLWFRKLYCCQAHEVIATKGARAVRVNAWARRKRKAKQDASNPTCLLCGGTIPRTSPRWYRKNYCCTTHKYAAQRGNMHQRSAQQTAHDEMAAEAQIRKGGGK